MGTSIRGKSPHEADTRTTVGRGPGVGRGRRVRAEETIRGYDNPAPSRCSLLYTFAPAPYSLNGLPNGADDVVGVRWRRCPGARILKPWEA